MSYKSVMVIITLVLLNGMAQAADGTPVQQALEEDVTKYREAVSIAPKDDSAWNLLGNAYYSLSRYDEAVTAYREALSISPSPTYWTSLGNTYNKLGRYDEAVTAHQEAIRIDLEHIQAWEGLILAYRGQGLDGVAEVAEKALTQLKLLKGQ